MKRRGWIRAALRDADGSIGTGSQGFTLGYFRVSLREKSEHWRFPPKARDRNGEMKGLKCGLDGAPGELRC
jgi:hypothetical protein